MAEKSRLIIEVQKVDGGWAARAELLALNGNVYETSAVVRHRPEGGEPLPLVAGDDELPDLDQADDDDDAKRPEAVRQALDQAVALLELPYVKAVLPPSVRATIFAIKAIRKQMEKAAGGSIAARFEVGKLHYELENPIINKAVRAQRLFGGLDR